MFSLTLFASTQYERTRMYACMRACVCRRQEGDRFSLTMTASKRTRAIVAIQMPHFCINRINKLYTIHVFIYKMKNIQKHFLLLFSEKKVDQLVCSTIVSLNLMTNLIYWEPIVRSQNIFFQFHFNWNMARKNRVFFYTNCAFCCHRQLFTDFPYLSSTIAYASENTQGKKRTMTMTMKALREIYVLWDLVKILIFFVRR